LKTEGLDFRAVTIVRARGTITNAKWVGRLKLGRTRTARFWEAASSNTCSGEGESERTVGSRLTKHYWNVRCKKRLRHNQKTIFWTSSFRRVLNVHIHSPTKMGQTQCLRYNTDPIMLKIQYRSHNA
jgi:hypothetical protein